KAGSYTIPDRPIDVFVDSLDDSGITIEGRCSVKTPDYWPARRLYTKEIKRLYEENGIEIPFPQMDVHVK
ncbi:MAG: mechanosensitive ion channel family protein, partial [Lachnospiraceae bacterium]